MFFKLRRLLDWFFVPGFAWFMWGGACVYGFQLHDWLHAAELFMIGNVGYLYCTRRARYAEKVDELPDRVNAPWRVIPSEDDDQQV